MMGAAMLKRHQCVQSLWASYGVRLVVSSINNNLIRWPDNTRCPVGRNVFVGCVTGCKNDIVYPLYALQLDQERIIR